MPEMKPMRRFRKVFPAIERILDRVEYDTNGGCWLWSGSPSTGGYGQVREADGTRVRNHRASYEHFKGPIPPGMFVCHKCDVRACVNPDHLFAGTPQENAIDAVRKGRANKPVGERHKNSKIKDSDVPKIKALLDSGLFQWQIAEMFGVTQTAISKIKLNRRITTRNTQ